MSALSACRHFITETMGLCLSCCPRESDRESTGPDGDRSRLLNGEVVPGMVEGAYGRDLEEDLDEIPYGSLGDPNRGSGVNFSSASVTKSKVNDEQSALNDIVNHMANNVIDVNGAHSTVTLEPAELQERAYEYGRQLQAVSARLAQKYAYLRNNAANRNDVMQDLSTAHADRLLQGEVLSTNDRILVNEVAARAREANAEFRIQPVPNLIGIFGQIRKNSPVPTLSEEDQEEEDMMEEDNSRENSVRQSNEDDDEDNND